MSSNKSRVARLMVAWLAVTVVIMTTACTKSGGGKTPVRKPVQTANPPPSGGTVAPELDANSGNSSHDGAGSTAGNPAVEEPIVVQYDPSGKTPDQIFSSSDKQGVVANLDVVSDIQNFDGSPLVYSGSGQDSLREQLQALVNSHPNPQQRDADASLAAEIGLTTFNVDWHSRVATLNLLQVQNGRRYQVSLNAQLDNRMMARFGSLNYAPYWMAEAACMDLNGGCNTVHIKVQDNRYGRPRTAHVIVRETRATLFAEGNGYGLARNAEYDQLLEVFHKTAARPGASNTVQRLKLATSETINGSSTFEVNMTIGHQSPIHPQGGGQFLVWTGPLVKPIGSSHLSVHADIARPTFTSGGHFVTRDGLLADTIRETHLVRNDGRGNLQLRIIVRAATPRAQEEQLLVTVGRVHKPVRALILR